MSILSHKKINKSIMLEITIHINKSTAVRCLNHLYGSAFSQASDVLGFYPKYDTIFCLIMSSILKQIDHAGDQHTYQQIKCNVIIFMDQLSAILVLFGFWSPVKSKIWYFLFFEYVYHLFWFDNLETWICLIVIISTCIKLMLINIF